MCYEQCTISHFYHCENIRKCTYTNPDGVASYPPSLLLLGSKPSQSVTVQRGIKSSTGENDAIKELGKHEM